MEKQPKPSSLEAPDSYEKDGMIFTPTAIEKNLTRQKLSSMIHFVMSVSDTSEWDTMHEQIERIPVGGTDVITSGAYEYVKITRNANNTFDTERGTYDYD